MPFKTRAELVRKLLSWVSEKNTQFVVGLVDFEKEQVCLFRNELDWIKLLLFPGGGNTQFVLDLQ